jgi:hypothetical protein
LLVEPFLVINYSNEFFITFYGIEPVISLKIS